MTSQFEKIKAFVRDMSLNMVHENEEEQLIVVDDEDLGIKGLVIDCEDPILILEQLIVDVSASIRDSSEVLFKILQMNRGLVHGAFAIDDTGHKILFRDTLQLENLDFNEFEGTINSLSLGMAEFGQDFINFSRL